jgi:hypothetical protein
MSASQQLEVVEACSFLAENAIQETLELSQSFRIALSNTRRRTVNSSGVPNRSYGRSFHFSV